MPRRSIRLYLHDMLDQIELLDRATRGVSKTAFDDDFILQAALARFLEILGEAAKHVPAEVRVLAPTVPWRKIAGTRDMLIHGYADTDADIVWDTATVNVPQVRQALEDLLALLPDDA